MQEFETMQTEFTKDLEAIDRTVQVIKECTFSGAGSEAVYIALGLLKAVRDRVIQEIENEKAN